MSKLAHSNDETMAWIEENCEPGPDPEDICDHDEYDVDWEGRATCARCHANWWLTSDEHAKYIDEEARWAEAYDAMQRRENSWWWRAWVWLQRWRPKPKPKYGFAQRDSLDDEIPF